VSRSSGPGAPRRMCSGSAHCSNRRDHGRSTGRRRFEAGPGRRWICLKTDLARPAPPINLVPRYGSVARSCSNTATVRPSASAVLGPCGSAASSASEAGAWPVNSAPASRASPVEISGATTRSTPRPRTLRRNPTAAGGHGQPACRRANVAADTPIPRVSESCWNVV